MKILQEAIKDMISSKVKPCIALLEFKLMGFDDNQ